MPDKRAAEDWEPTQIIDWLYSHGRTLTSCERLLTELGQQLLAVKLPLLRMRISLPTLNPQVSRQAFTWWRGNDRIETFRAPHNIAASADYIDSPVEAIQSSKSLYRCRLATADHSSLHPVLQDLADQGATDYLALPIQFTFDNNLCPWILVTDHPDGFTPGDLAHLSQIASYLAPLLEVLAMHLTTESLLSTYLGPRTGRKVLDGRIQRGDAELIEAVIWYSDMRDSTAITEALDHDQLLGLLNCYFETVSRCVSRQGGEVLRFIGDAMLVVFTVDQYPSLAAAGEAALQAAEDTHQAISRCNLDLQQRGLPTIRYGLALDVGTVIYGNVGAPDRLDFTVMGSAVNRAARIETLTKLAQCALLVSKPFAELFPGRFCWKADYPVAGLDYLVSVYCVRCEDQVSDLATTPRDAPDPARSTQTVPENSLRRSLGDDGAESTR